MNLPLTGLTGRPFTLVAAEHILGAEIALTRFAHTDSNTPICPDESILRREAHYSAMLDGAVKEADSLFEAVSYALTRSHRAMDQILLFDVAHHIQRKRQLFKSPHSKAQLEQLLRFLSDSRHSPLMKGAVSHAFILATQPFSSGNGRIARLLNLFHLIRGGYAIQSSLSEVIARHSEDYIRAVRSLFLPSQPGSLTPFVEYIFGVLRECLGDRPDAGNRVLTFDAQSAETSAPDKKTAAPVSDMAKPADGSDSNPPSPAEETSDPVPESPSIWASLQEMENSKSRNVMRTAATAKDMLREGILEFSTTDWMERSGMSTREYHASREAMIAHGIIERIGTGKHNHTNIAVYRFKVDIPQSVQQSRLSPESDSEASTGESSPDRISLSDPPPPASPEPVLWPILNEMRDSRFEISRKAAEVLEGLLRDGFQEFDYNLWMSRSGMTYPEFDRCRKSLAKRQLITNLTPGPGKDAHYRICIPDDFDAKEPCDAPPVLTADYFWAIVENMECSKSERLCRAAGIIRSMIADGISEFTRSDWIAYSNMSSLEFTACRMAMLTKGLVGKVKNFGTDNLTLYRFTLQGIRTGIRPDVPPPPVIVELDTATFENQLKEMTASHSAVIRSAAAAITEMISEGSLEFTGESWRKRTGMTAKEYNTCISSMYTRNLLVRIGSSTNSAGHAISLYKLTWPFESRVPSLKAKAYTPPEKYRPLLERIAPLAPITNLPDKVIALRNRTPDCFRVEEWASVNNLSIDEANYEMNALIQMGLVYRQTIRGVTTFAFRFHDTDQLSQMIENEIHAPRHPKNNGFWTNLALLEFSHSSTIRKGAAEFYRIIEDGKAAFPPTYLHHRLNMSHRECRNVIRALQDKELITATGGNTKLRRYVINPIAFEK